MASTEAVEFANFFADLSQRSSNPAFDLSTVRDIIETMHVATKEPEGVTYAEVDAGGVEALWCIPAANDPDAVLLHNHMGGSVLTSMHSDRKAAAHIAKAAGVSSLVLNFRRSPEHRYPAQTCRSHPGAIPPCRAARSRATPIETSCFRVDCWSSSGPAGSTEPVWTSPTRR
jgi:epsilon-lactone hydrolase